MPESDLSTDLARVEQQFDLRIEATQIMSQDVSYAWIIAVRDVLVYQVVLNGRLVRLEVVPDEDLPDDGHFLPRTIWRIEEAMNLLAQDLSEADRRRITYAAQQFFGPSSIYDCLVSQDPMDVTKGINDVFAHFGRALLERST